jgi:uncharacterized repeat protein (TIGR04076 family)
VKNNLVEEVLGMNLDVKVKEIQGRCPVYRVGDSFRLEDGYRLVTKIPLCMHGLASIVPHYNALCVSEPDRWGLAGKKEPSKAYVQCLDPMEYTHGGTVVFEISRSDS